MELDGKTLTDGATLDADLCVVGAGPAGLALAAQFIDQRCDVILLESGAHWPEPEILALNDGDVSGDDYAGLQKTRHRQIGGSSWMWNTGIQKVTGAKYAPLDPIDMEKRSPIELSGWPLAYEELIKYYERAQSICGLGPFAYDAGPWIRSGHVPFQNAGTQLVSRVYQLGTRGALLKGVVGPVLGAANLRLFKHATVLRLETNGFQGRVLRAAIASPGGPQWSVRAKHFVLAAGAVENARILLVSGNEPEGLGNQFGWVGRCFMEHPRDRSLFLTPRSQATYQNAAFYDSHTAVDGTMIQGRLALADETVRSEQLLNSSATLLPLPKPGVLRSRDALMRLGLLHRVESWLPGVGLGWSRCAFPSQLLEGFNVLLNLEQAPHPENRVHLGPRRDALGVPLPELHWRWRAEDQVVLERVRTLFAREVQAAGIGLVSVKGDSPPDPNAHHHAGTTRMSADPRFGVVDAHGRVHSVDNLFIAGASVFPTAGFANPVLSIVALAVRLADHLKGMM